MQRIVARWRWGWVPSLSLELHTLEPVAGMDSGKKAKKNSIQFQILNHFPNALLSCEITHMTICTAIQNRFQDWLYTYFALSDEDR